MNLLAKTMVKLLKEKASKSDNLHQLASAVVRGLSPLGLYAPGR